MVLLLSSGLGSFWYFGGFWSHIFSATSYSAFYILPVVCLHFPECDVFNVLSSACVLWKNSASFSFPPGATLAYVYGCPQVPVAMLSFITSLLSWLRLGHFHSPKFTGGLLCQFCRGAIRGILVFSFCYGIFQF